VSVHGQGLFCWGYRWGGNRFVAGKTILAISQSVPSTVVERHYHIIGILCEDTNAHHADVNVGQVRGGQWLHLNYHLSWNLGSERRVFQDMWLPFRGRRHHYH